MTAAWHKLAQALVCQMLPCLALALPGKVLAQHPSGCHRAVQDEGSWHMHIIASDWLSVASYSVFARCCPCKQVGDVVQCKGGETIAGASWMNLNGNAGQVMLPMLRILSSPDQLHRSHLCSTPVSSMAVSQCLCRACFTPAPYPPPGKAMGGDCRPWTDRLRTRSESLFWRKLGSFGTFVA